MSINESTGRTTLRELDESRAAAASIEHFGMQDEDGRWHPMFVDDGSIDRIAEQLARATGRHVEDAAFQFAKRLIDIRLANRGRSPEFLGAVSLDVNPEGQHPRTLGHPSAPQVVFYEIRRGTMLYDEATRRAMAVWYQPELDEVTGHAMSPRQGRNGRWYCDDTFIPGYLGIVDWYAGLYQAEEARRDLEWALKLLATPPESADVDDDQRFASYEEAEHEDGERRRREPAQREVQPF